MHWNRYTTDAQNPLLHVSVLYGCHHQGVFTVLKAVLSKWSVVCTTVHACTRIVAFLKTQEIPPVKW